MGGWVQHVQDDDGMKDVANGGGRYDVVYDYQL
jgi:hypothetical protein